MRDPWQLQKSTRLLHNISEHISLWFTQAILFASVQKIHRHIPTSPYVEVEQLIVKYGQQMVIKHRTDGLIRTFLYRTQFDWLNANFQKMGCQKISSTDVEETIKPVYQIRKRIVRSSVPKFMHWDLKKGILWEHLLVLHTRRFYWPGSYALRGVIVQCMQRWGAPLFLEHYIFRRKHWNLHKFVKLLKLRASHESRVEDVPVFITQSYSYWKNILLRKIWNVLFVYVLFLKN